MHRNLKDAILAALALFRCYWGIAVDESFSADKLAGSSFDIAYASLVSQDGIAFPSRSVWL